MYVYLPTEIRREDFFFFLNRVLFLTRLNFFYIIGTLYCTYKYNKG